MSDPVAIAREAWGEGMPDWVERLARECATASQSKVAARLNRSASLVSLVLRKRYPGDMRAVEEVVRGVFEQASVACPALGTIATNVCRDWMLLSRSFANTNSQRVRMYRACNACPRARKEAANV